MGRTWSTHGRPRSACKDLVWQPEGKKLCARPRRRWKEYITMCLKEIWSEDVESIQVPDDGVQWTFGLHKGRGAAGPTEVHISFLRRIVPHATAQISGNVQELLPPLCPALYWTILCQGNHNSCHLLLEDSPKIGRWILKQMEVNSMGLCGRH
jgi:hypothetical protein